MFEKFQSMFGRLNLPNTIVERPGWRREDSPEAERQEQPGREIQPSRSLLSDFTS